MPNIKRLTCYLLGVALLLASPARADTQVTSTHVTPQSSAAAETSHVVPGGVLFLHGAQVTTGAAAGFFIILNAAADPGNGAILPKKCIQVAANSVGTFSPDTNTIWDFPAGVVLLFSTTGCFTETTSATAFFSWQ